MRSSAGKLRSLHKLSTVARLTVVMKSLVIALQVLLAIGCTSPRQDIPPPLPEAACENPPTAQSSRIQGEVTPGLDGDARERAALLNPDRITVVTCGTGSPVPSDRAQSCAAVFVGGQMLVFDVGDGAQPSMERLNLPVQDVSAVFITHFHSDHIADLGELISRSWILGRTTELPVIGPEGIDRVVSGFNQVYVADEAHRIAHHGEAIMRPGVLAAIARRFSDPGPDGAVVFDQGGVVVKAFRVDHTPIQPAVGYRIEHRGRVVSISGDTVDTPAFRTLATGADILVAEVMDKHFTLDMSCALGRAGSERSSIIFRDIYDYHTDTLELAQLSAAAGVKTLMLTHQVPSLPSSQAQGYFSGPIQRYFSGELVVSEDGSRRTLDL
ncbi:MAG: MBL fold metallo-hydrolase [Myxococcales bacterium]|nr:MBL fold metallo-hydrolase [Myxococcales bacterium]MDP3501066.1 MBL fold metallo-hydrolase [Myxococcales bacterium]